MAKNDKTAAVKGRETKLNKKSNEELIQIILKKDKVERNLNNQIKSIKGEVNYLNDYIKNLNADMDGTIQTLDSYKDKLEVASKKNHSLMIEAKDNNAMYKEENMKVITLANKVNMWKIATYIMTVVAAISIIIALL